MGNYFLPRPWPATGPATCRIVVGKGLWRHRDLPPHPLATCLDLASQVGFGVGAASVLGSDLPEAGTDDLVLRAVAGGAAVLLRQRQRCATGAARRGLRCGRGSGHGDSRGVGRWRPCGVGAALRAHGPLLFGQVAVVVTGVVGQERGHLRLGGAVGHARRRLHVGPAAVAHALARPQAMVGGLAVAVGQPRLGLGDGGVRQHEVVGHDAAHVQQVGGDGVDLFGAQRLGCRPGHGAVDVVPQRRDAGDLHQRGAARKAGVVEPRHTPGLDVVLGGAAHQGREHLVALAEDAVAGGALALPHIHALGHRAGALGQALEVRAHIDVPGLHLLGRGGAADAGVGRPAPGPPAGGSDQRQPQQHAHGSLTTAGHSSPRRIPAPATTGWRCCGKSTGCRAPRAPGWYWGCT